MELVTIASRIRRGTRRAWWAAYALALLVGLGRAQVVDELPAEYEAGSTLEWLTAEQRAADPRASARVLERYAFELEAGRHAHVLGELAADFRASPWPTHAGEQARFQAQLDRIARAFFDAQARVALPKGVIERAQRDAVMKALADQRLGVQSLVPEVVLVPPDSSQTLVFFAGTPYEIVTYRDTPDGRIELLVPPELMRDLRLRAEGVRAVLQDFVEPLQARAFDRIQRADRQWTNILEHGYSQYPWESLVNGWVLDFDAFHPPSHQWILLHPTIGFAASTGDLDDVRVNEVLNLELVGHVWYRGDEYESYFGGSIAATLRDDLDPGLGAVFHWNKTVSLGIAWHDVDERGGIFDDDPFVYMSVDLFRFVRGAGSKYQSARNRVRSLLPD